MVSDLVTQLANLERPSLLQDLASDIKSRATLMLHRSAYLFRGEFFRDVRAVDRR